MKKYSAYQALLWTGIIALLSFLFIKTQGFDYEAHAKTLSLVRSIGQLDTKLNEDILEARLGILNNYDPLMDTVGQIENIHARLKSTQTALYHAGHKDIDARLDAAILTFAHKQSGLERFKSKNTQYRNALAHLSFAMSYFAGGAPSLVKALPADQLNVLQREMGDILSDTFMYAAVDDVRHLRPHIEAQLESIQVLRKSYPAEQQEAVRVALAHIENVLQLKPEVTALTNELIALPSARRYDDLYQACQSLGEAKTAETVHYRLALYLGSILMLGYIGYILIRLRQNRRALEETNSELEFQKLALDRHAIVSITDARGRITYANDQFCEISQYSREELLGQNHRIVNSGLHPKDFFSALWKTISSGQVWQGAIRNRKKDGSFYWVETTVAPFLDHTGKPSRYVSIRTDTTQQKEAEEALRRSNDALEERVRIRTADLEANNAQTQLILNQLQQRNEENSMLVYSVSHDLRSPLVNLQGFSKELVAVAEDLRGLVTGNGIPDEIQKRGLILIDSDMQGCIKFIQAGVMRLSNIIDALLRLSRAGQVEYHWTEVDTGLVIKRIMDSMQAVATERDAAFTAGDLPPIWGDATAVEQIFANLIGNALNYLDPKRPGIIEIGWKPDADASRRTYYVRDNGLGMSEAAKSKLFQIFQRFHPDKAKGEGVGLSIVRRMVVRHSGKIWVESREGEGTTFFVSLPIHTMEAAA